jgi:hypothetical protein
MTVLLKVEGGSTVEQDAGASASAARLRLRPL